ncbi:MAG TPA: DUF2892 domain-containing protein [bacterium]|nr:DUF2892 domain-containing protein [bacterium]
MKITANVGGWDRTIRLILGVVLFVLGFTGVFQGVLAIIGYIVGAIALITGLTTFCPANALLGFNSRKAATSPPETGAGGGTGSMESTE